MANFYSLNLEYLQTESPDPIFQKSYFAQTFGFEPMFQKMGDHALLRFLKLGFSEAHIYAMATKYSYFPLSFQLQPLLTLFPIFGFSFTKLNGFGEFFPILMAGFSGTESLVFQFKENLRTSVIIIHVDNSL